MAFETLKSQLQDNLRAAVEACAPNERTGAFLSGGLDSSSVAGMLARVQGRSSRTFSIGFGVDAYDELTYARIANRHFHSQGHEYQVTPEDVVDAFRKIALAYDEPFGNSSAVPTYYCAKLAREHGVDHLLAGDGGDEIFGGNERYVRQQMFERYFWIPGWIRSTIIEPLAHAARADSALAPLRKLRSYVDQATVRLPERLETWNLIYREGAERVIDPEFLQSIDPQRTAGDDAAGVRGDPGNIAVESHAVLRLALHALRQRLAQGQHHVRARWVRESRTRCSIRRVVDVSLRVPSALKIEGTELRSFYKRAMADFLPAEILSQAQARLRPAVRRLAQDPRAAARADPRSSAFAAPAPHRAPHLHR